MGHIICAILLKCKFLGNSQSVSCINMKPVRSGHGWVRMCGPHNPPANVSYANFTIKFGNEIPPLQNGVLARKVREIILWLGERFLIFDFRK